MKNRRQQGIALITALLVLLLVSSIIVGLSWLVMTDTKLGSNNADRQMAFYGAESGMEALTANLATDFNLNYDLSVADINAITSNPPTNIPNIQYLKADGTSGYEITYSGAAPTTYNGTILSGTAAGLTAELTPYTLYVTARTPSGSEVKLQRLIQTVAIPVFQFGIFSTTDLSFFAGPDFDFGGRVHTNTNLWLAENGGTLTLEDKVTAAGEIVRTNLENGTSTGGSYNTTVNISRNPGSGSYAALSTSQGSTLGNSVYGAVSASLNEPTFSNLASGTYNGNIGVKETGVTALNVGIATPSLGGQSIDLIRLPLNGELASNPAKLAERYYSLASVRILLSDYGSSGTCTNSDIMNLPNISAGTPVDLGQLSSSAHAPAWASALMLANKIYPLPASGAGGGAAYSGTTATGDGYWTKNGDPIITGCIKIDYQTMAGGAWTDVTSQILSLGYTGRNVNPLSKANLPASATKRSISLPGSQVAGQGPTIASASPIGCLDPSTTAVIRLARLRDNPSTAYPNGGCGSPTQVATDYWPNVLFDTREGTLRDESTTGAGGAAELTLAGTMNYVELDVKNLAAWLVANAGVVNNTTGYTIYFSDRRGDQVDSNPPASVVGGNGKTAAFGYEDFVNPADATNGCPDGTLNQGEDVESDYTNGVSQNTTGYLRVYGGTPTIGNTDASDPGVAVVPLTGVLGTVIVNNPHCAAAGHLWPFAVATAPDATHSTTNDLRENSPLLFRRALKIVDGGSISIGTCDAVPCGLTIVAENPVYVQGDYNDPGLDTTFASTDPHVACAIIADAVTLLSDEWNDVNSFAFPYTLGSRLGSQTMYRTAIVGGKGIPFTDPGGVNGADFGTDGGMHNFLRYLEDWQGELYYHGSIVSLYYSHQAVGTYKCCNEVYSPPTRGYKFDTEFLTPSLLPPQTPMLRSVNTTGFSQILTPSQNQ